MVRAHYPRMGEPARADGDGGRLADAVADVVPRTYELSEFLIDVLGVTDVGARFPHRVTYHPTCHSLRLLRVGDRPRQLLEAVRGLELVELDQREECCGVGGTFAVKNSAVSTAMGSDKARNAVNSRAEVLCSADNSCLMHIGGILSRQHSGMRVMHLAEILAAT
jgi:L-lactate dehydrogenase complex protein LldE